MKLALSKTRTAVLLALPLLAAGAPASAHDHDSPLSNVPAANKKAPGYAPAHVLAPELRQKPVAQGSVALENPEGIVTHYGYQNDAPSTTDPALPQMVPGATTAPLVEAQKTEPDKNTYLVLHDQKGADPDYDYGTHFLFQGHELGVAGRSYITRINLDADSAHR